MFMETVTEVTEQETGMPETFILFELPATLLSGTAMLIDPEQNWDVTGPREIFSFNGGSLIHINAGEGTTTGAGGVELTNAVAVAVQPVAVTIPVTVYIVDVSGAA